MSRIALSGAIAVGKSTLAERLISAHPMIKMHQEDLPEFRLLSQFYENPSRFAFSSRIEFLAIKAAELAGSPDEPGIGRLFDRVLPELVTFARVMHKSGLMSEEELGVYQSLHGLLVNLLPRFDAIIWVRCDTDVCLERIRMRNRWFEQGIQASYLDALDDEYRSWIDAAGHDCCTLQVDTTRHDANLVPSIVGWLKGNRLLLSNS